MNSRERFFAAAMGQEVDRVPVVMWHHYTGENERGENNVRQHVKFARETRADVVKISFDGYFAYPLESPIQKASDWRNIRKISRKHAYFQEQIHRVRRVNEELQAEFPSIYVVFAPFSYMRHSTSDELVMAHLREDPESVLEGLKFFAEETLQNMRNVMEYGGCDGMLLCLQAGEEGRFTVEEYLDTVRPFDDIMLHEAAGYSKCNVAHLCGWAGVKNQLDCWRNLDPGINIVNWATAIEDIALADGRARFQPRTIMGGFDNRAGKLLSAGSEQEIKAYAKNLLASAGQRATIIGADCSVPEDIDHAHIRWVVEACEEYAKEQKEEN